MRTVTVYRSDFGNRENSERTSYFEYLLRDLGILEKEFSRVNEVTIGYEFFEAYDAEGNKLTVA